MGKVKPFILIFSILSAFAMFGTACSSSSSNPLLSDYSAPGACLIGNCVVTTPEPNAVSLLKDSGVTVTIAVGQPYVELTGDCFVSSYKNNIITLTLPGGAGLAGFGYKAINASSSFPSSQAKCSNGRYHILIDSTSNFTQASTTYNVLLTLNVYDSNNQPVQGLLNNSIGYQIYRQ